MATIPSIAMIPSGVKASKLYSVLPTDGAGDFTTTRASVATRVNENGLIEEVAANVPRLDYSDGTCPSLLLEPTATNLITYSEDFSSFTQNGCSVISDNISFVGGGLADKIQEDSLDTNKHIRPQSLSVTSGQSYIMSAWFKTDNCDVIALREGSSSGDSITYKFSTGTTSAIGTRWTTLNVVNFPNGWRRIDAKYTSTSTASMNFRVHLLGNNYNQVTNPNPSTYTYQGDGTSGVYMWGFTVEQNSYATSYIKTVGTAQTRVADTASGSGNSTVINSTEGTLYAEISALANDGTTKAISISDGTDVNRVRLIFDSASQNTVGYLIYVNGVVVAENSFISSDITQFSKYAVKWSVNDFALWINGIKVKSDDNGVTFSASTLNTLQFADGDGTSRTLFSNVKSVQVYTTALSDAELTTLTTI